MDPGKVIEEFRAAMDAAGIPAPEEIIADDKLHRFEVAGEKRGNDQGWYVLHLDGIPAGGFGSWKTGQNETWCAKIERRMTTSERRAFEATIEAQRKQREAEEAQLQTAAAFRALELWDSAAFTVNNPHPYLERKAVVARGLRTDAGDLLVPIRDALGRLWNIQRIDRNGAKRFLYGGRVTGCYCAIAKGPASGTVLICEGYATGASLHAATELPVVVAFNTANLEPVARVIREKYPADRIVICADNDAWTTRPVKNPGLYYGCEAANKINGLIVFPGFSQASLANGNKPTDFNDLAQLEGLPRVAEVVEAAVPPQGEKSGGIGGVAEQPPAPIPPGRELEHLPPAKQPFAGAVDFPHLDRNRPLPTIENVAALLKALDIRARYDVIRKDLNIVIPNSRFLIDTEKNDQLTLIRSAASLCKLPTAQIHEIVSFIACQNFCNPVEEWVMSQPWDGVSRLDDFYETVVAEGDENATRRGFKEIILKRWMISAIAAAFRPKGVSAHGILVFKGPQYIGKTNWFKSLVPQELALTRDGMLLDPKDKDSVYQIVSNWIVELGEIDATFRKADIAQLKAFITKDKDTIRLPYAHYPSSFARRTVFFASVNEDQYLSDPTGNRRFWTVDCKTLHHDHQLNMQQIWAEFHNLYKKGEPWYLNADEMAFLNAHNKGFEVVNPIEELVRAKYPWGIEGAKTRQLTAAEIAIEVGFKFPTLRETRAIGKVIRDITGQDPKPNNGRRVFEVPGVPPAPPRPDPYS